MGRLVDEAVRSISSHHPGWELDMHVVLPDHVHVILLAGDRAGQVRPNDRAGQARPLRDVVGAFKAQASRRGSDGSSGSAAITTGSSEPSRS